MAKYTELLVDYLDGNSLPVEFATIEGFEDMFIGRFCDREIGFETEALFKIKVQNVTDIYFNLYKERITDLASAITKAKTPLRITYTQQDLGKTKGKLTDLPIDSDEAEAKTITETDASKNTTSKEVSGVNTYEAIKLIDYLNKSVKCIVNDLLDKYETCFMGIF